MAFLVSEPIALTPTTTAAASYSVTLSTLGLSLVNDDWLILSVMCAATSGTLAINGASTGWTEISELDVGSGQRMARYKCKVASGTATDPQIDLSTGTGQWRGSLEQWRDADATDCVDSSAVSAGSNASSEVTGELNAGTISKPSSNNCAISYFSCARLSGSSPVLRFKSSEVVGRLIQAADDGSIFTSIALGTVQQTTAAATAKTVYVDRTARVGTITVAIKNKTSGGLMSDCRAGVEKMVWMGTFGTAHESLGTTWGAPSTFVAWTGGTIGGITADNTAPTINNDTSGAGLPWGSFSSVSSNVNTAGAIVGGWIALPATIDLTSKFVFLEWFFNLMGTTVGSEGAFLALGDNATASTGNAVVYRLAPKSAVLLNVLNSSVIDPATATTFDAEGSINLATINKVGFFYHRVGSATTARTLIVRNLLAIANSALVGGNAGKPLDVRFLDPALNGWGYTGICQKQGDAVLVKTPVQFGDGTFPTYVDSTATLLNTPAGYSTSTQPFWNAAANSLTVGVKGASGDTLNFIASALVAGPGAEQNFTVDAATSSGANVSLQGGVFGNWLWTGDTDFDPTGATYSGCDEVAWKGALVTNCTVTDTTSADAAASVDANTTITGTTIDGTGALYALELGASVTAVTLTNCTLTAGSTDKVHVLATTSTVTITISGTTNLNPDGSEVTSAGATVVIAAPELYQSVAITGLAATYRLQIFDIEYVLTVSGITVTPTAGATYTHNGITWTVRSATIVVGAGTITVYGTGTPSASGTLTKASGTGDASVTFSAYAVDGTELYIGVPAATSYTWTDSVAAAAPRVIRVRVMEDGPGTSDAIEMIDAIVGMCGITDGTESVGYLVAAVADDVYNDRGVDGSAITGITIDDTTLRLEIASGTITNYNGTDVLVVDGRDLYAYETYWLGTTAGMRDEARFIEAIDAVNFRCSNFKLKGTSGYPIMIRNCYMVDAATGIFASLVDYSGDPISNAPDHMAAIVVSTSDSVVTGSLSEFIAAVPTANAIANQVVNGITFP